MACEHCHYFRGLKGTPFGRCYNHPFDEEVLFDDDTNLIGDIDFDVIFTVNRFATYMCETVPTEPRPWDEPNETDIN
jgi:hypothetical protein